MLNHQIYLMKKRKFEPGRGGGVILFLRYCVGLLPFHIAHLRSNDLPASASAYK